MEIQIPISAVELGEEAERLVLEVLRSGQLAQGPVVERLEEAFAQMCRVDHAVAMSSGTAALVAALRGLGVGAGDEVVTSPFTFVATLNAILDVGATARFADIEDESFTIDPSAVLALVGPQTKAILPVHLFGQPADVPSLMTIADQHALCLVEDAAQAHGAEIADQPVGSFGVGCFSFYATKNVASGEGGIVTTNDAALADRLRLLRNQGMRRRYEYELIGSNYRLTDLQAAVALPQVLRLPERTKARQENAAELTLLLEGLPGITTPPVLPGRTHVFHQFTIRVGPTASRNRDEVVAELADRGIGAGIYYPRPVHAYRCYENHPGVAPDPTPRAEQAGSEVLSLPIHPALREDAIKRVAGALWDILG